MGSDESNFNVSLTVRDKVTRQCPQTTTVEEKGEPKWIRTEGPLCLLGQRLTARPNRLRDRQANRQTDSRRTDRQTETGRQREKHRQRESII